MASRLRDIHCTAIAGKMLTLLALTYTLGCGSSIRIEIGQSEHYAIETATAEAGGGCEVKLSSKFGKLA